MFLRKAVLLISFFLLTPLIIIVSTVFYAYRDFRLHTNNFAAFSSNVINENVVYAALPSTAQGFAGGVIAGDARVEKVKNFFASYNSILSSYAGLFVANADKYGFDYRLLPAIAMQESIGCKREIPGTFNCFGWGITSRNRTSFSSYEEAITTISKLMAKNFINKGFNTPEEIGKKYNPDDTNGWVSKVNFFMDRLQNQTIMPT